MVKESEFKPEYIKEKYNYLMDTEYKVDDQKEFLEKGGVIIKSVFMRHGEKEPDPKKVDSGLTYRGIFQAAVLAVNREAKDRKEIYYSDVSRAKDTGKYQEAVTQSSGGENINLVGPKEELHYRGKMSKEFVDSMLKIKEKEMANENGDEQEIERRVGEKQMDYFLKHDDQKPDEGTYSPKELANELVKVLKQNIGESESTEKGKIKDIINVTHDFHISAFLKYAIGFENMEEVGGPVRPAESFEVTIKNNRDEKNKKVELILYFRGKEYNLDLSKFE